MKSFEQFFKPNENIQYDPTELRMGIEVEHEHTELDELAEIIAKHHLAEDPQYYTKLKTLNL